MGGNGQRHGKLKDILNVRSPTTTSEAAVRKSRLDDSTIGEQLQLQS
jgi:hypothetical protein